MTDTQSQQAPRVGSDESGIRSTIEWQTEASVAYYNDHQWEIGRRLDELDREWDIERAYDTAASSVTLFGLVMGLAKTRWLMVPLIVQSLFLRHAARGERPQVAALRRLGFRTREEIDRERFALMSLRGDFQETR